MEGRRRWFGEGEGWRREVDWGELELDWGLIMIHGFFWGGWADRAEEEGRVERVAVADILREVWA